MSPPTTPLPNNKRYWGEEKNIDSIYAVYLKKISYSFNNDISISAAYTVGQLQHTSTNLDAQHQQDDTRSTISSSSHDLAKTSSSSTQNNHTHFGLNLSAIKRHKNNDNNSTKHKLTDETPRSRRNFFQKYRRRSCSMDKYSLERQQQQQNQILCSTPLSNKSSKDMRYTAPVSGKKLPQIQNHHRLGLSNQESSVIHDGLDSSINTDQIDSSKNGTTTKNPSLMKQQQKQQSKELHKSTVELSSQTSQSLQWETRQVKILLAATLDHVLKFILIITPSNDVNNLDASTNNLKQLDDSALEEERNNVAHIIHVLFCTYRIYTNPYELMLKLMDYSDICRIEQYRFVMHYWMDNYPEDFDYVVEYPENGSHRESERTSNSNNPSGPSMVSYNNSITSYDSLNTTKTAATTDSDNSADPTSGGSQSEGDNLDRRMSNLSIRTPSEPKSGVILVNELLRLCQDDYIREKANKMGEIKSRNLLLTNSESCRRSRHHQTTASRNSAVLDLDSRYVAQQLTAIDLENFLNLRPYSLLEGTKSDKRITSMIKNFNILSRHVVVTILKSHNPHIVSSHWIAIAMNLRKIKNFNSLKAIIAGLTNESIYRLKQVIWNKLDRTSLTNFKLMAAIVDDVNNQTVLRQTQLIVEGTAKMNIEDDSFGTIPYLGTFLTDLNMIDARYSSYVPSPKDETSKLKLINFEKCAKQFEILTQVQLLQKNVLASLHALQRRNHFDEQTTLNRLKHEYSQNNHVLLTKPAIPQVSRLFENWFYDSNVTNMTDKQCYEISITMEPNVISR